MNNSQNNELTYMDRYRDLFSRPVIIGASISAGYGTNDGGPGTLLARMINPLAEVINFAFNGATSKEASARLNLNAHNPSIVMALDLFFWDAVRGQIDINFEKNTTNFFNTLHAKEIPMIVGKLPVIDLPFGAYAETIKRNAQKVNALLDELITPDKRCLLYDPLDCFIGMDSGKYFSDGLHLNREGNLYCARYLAENGHYHKLIK